MKSVFKSKRINQDRLFRLKLNHPWDHWVLHYPLLVFPAYVWLSGSCAIIFGDIIQKWLCTVCLFFWDASWERKENKHREALRRPRSAFAVFIRLYGSQYKKLFKSDTRWWSGCSCAEYLRTEITFLSFHGVMKNICLISVKSKGLQH